MTDLEVYSGIDEIFLDSKRDISILYHIEPNNVPEQEEKFFASKTCNPVFSYKDMGYDPDKVERNLNSIKIPDDEIGRVYMKESENILLENRVVRNRGNKDVVKEATIAINSVPDKELNDYADMLLKIFKENAIEETEKNVPAE